MPLREHYLRALGIDTWHARHATPQAAAPELPLPVPDPVREPAHEPMVPQISSASADVDMLWQQLADEVRGCTRCDLASTRTQTVFGVGNRQAELLVIGEAPGADEDRQGEPFVGRAGQLLNSMLRALGSPRDTVYIANVLKCRPPGNRDPNPVEVSCCLGYLHRQLALVRPKLLLAVGRIAAQNLLATDTPIGKLRGSLHRFGPDAVPLIVTYHPAYLLRSPLEKRRAWQDLKFVRSQLRRLRETAS